MRVGNGILIGDRWDVSVCELACRQVGPVACDVSVQGCVSNTVCYS